MQTLWFHQMFSFLWSGNQNNAACDFPLEILSCSGDNVDWPCFWPFVTYSRCQDRYAEATCPHLSGNLAPGHRRSLNRSLTHHWTESAPLVLNSGSFKVHNISVWNMIVTLLNWLTALAFVPEKRENKETYRQIYVGGDVETQSWSPGPLKCEYDFTGFLNQYIISNLSVLNLMRSRCCNIAHTQVWEAK